MKWFMYILGVLLILIGIVWILQGVNVLGGSPMTGHIQYAFLGIIADAIGIALLVVASRRGRIANTGDRSRLDK